MARSISIATQIHDLDPAAEDSGLGSYSDDRVAAVAAKAFARIAEAWKLKNDDAANLLGVSTRTWGRIKSGEWMGHLKKDQLMRISAVTGLYKALHLYFSDALADEWVSLANAGPLFAGRTPKAAMLDGGLPAMIEIRNYVDALRGGA